MKKIKLVNSDLLVLVDDEDYKMLNQFEWRFNVTHPPEHGYVVTGESLRIHRLIMNAQPNELIDHKNHNTLDNQKQNLRKSTSSQNNQNRSKFKNTNFKYKGIVFNGSKKKYYAKLQINGTRIYSEELFLTEIEAAKEYDRLALKHFGEFAKLNFPT